LPLVLFGVLWADLVRQLSYEWAAREQYAYGWFVPFFAAALLWRRWLDRPAPNGRRPAIWMTGLVIVAVLALLPMRVIYEINPDWPLLGWLYTLIVVGGTLYAFWLAGGLSWTRHFAFPVAFILVAVVWPYRIEKALTQNLMQVVAGVTVELLGWFNIPAFQHGNLIELSTGVVGIDEACSGIRSFQSTLMAALLMGELYRLRVWARAGLVGCGLLLAFCFNVVRTLLLSWQASQHGIAIIDKWHDPAGMTIAVACFFALWLLAVLFQSKWRVAPDLLAAQKLDGGGRPLTSPREMARQPISPGSLSPREMAKQPISPGPLPRTYLLAVGCWAILCLVATEVWYRSHEVKDAGVFHWTAVVPENKPGFQKIELPPRSLKLLAFDAGSTSKWNEDDGSEFSLSFFRWNPRSIRSVIYSRVHRPEVCLPASGYKQLTESELVFFDAGQLKLPFRKYTYASEGQILYVFFCQWEDGAEKQTGMGASEQTERLRTVWVGRRLVGQQTLEIIVTGSPSLATAEALVRRRLPELIRPSGS
jgi:exosortase